MLTILREGPRTLQRYFTILRDGPKALHRYLKTSDCSKLRIEPRALF